MPSAKKTQAAKIIVPEPENKTPKISLPSLNFLNKNYTPILIILLLIASFMLGSLTTKVTYLEQQAKNNQKTPETQQAAAQQQPSKPKIELSTIKGLFEKDVVKFGDANKKLLFVEIGDPSCPYCHAATGKNPQLNKDMGERFTLTSDGGSYVAPVEEMRKLIESGDAGFVFIYQNGHGNGQMATKAFYCGHDMGKFWPVHDKLMTSEGYKVINEEVKNEKSKAGQLAEFLAEAADSNQMKTCLESNKYDDRLNSDMQLAQSLGAGGTPGFFINSTFFEGAYSWTEMKSAIE